MKSAKGELIFKKAVAINYFAFRLQPKPLDF
jgi:hypothetical protein